MTFDTATRARFDELQSGGERAVLDGTHTRETPLADGGRYGLSIVLLPDRPTADRLGQLTAEALVEAGPGHWPTGSPDTLHVTIRALEAHRSKVPADDPLVARAGSALIRAAARSRPVSMALRGLTLTSTGVMLRIRPEDEAAPELAAAIGEELGDDGWFERDYQRTIWYSMLVHFAAPITDPARLIAWVRDRRAVDLGRVRFDAAQLTRWRYDGTRTRCTVLTTAPLGR